MKLTSAAPALFSLFLFGFLVSPAAGRLSPKGLDSRDIHYGITERQAARFYRRDEPSFARFPGDFSNSQAVTTALGWEFTGCDVQNTSPTYADAIDASNEIASQGDQSCVPEDSSTSHCVLIKSNLSVEVYFCGTPGIPITCIELADIVFTMSGMCAKEVGGDLRVRGTVALFPGGDPLDYSKLSFITVVPLDDEFLKDA